MSGVQGLAEAYALLGNVPEAAKEELGIELGILAQEALAIQRAATPVDSGALRAGLSIKLLIDQLKVRIGLFGKAARKDLFYGRVVYYGRKPNTVVVERRRRVNGKLRLARRRKIAADISSTYALKIKARAAVPYIDAPGRAFQDEAVQQLAEYWSRVLARAGGSA